MDPWTNPDALRQLLSVVAEARDALSTFGFKSEEFASTARKTRIVVSRFLSSMHNEDRALSRYAEILQESEWPSDYVVAIEEVRRHLRETGDGTS